MTFRGRLMAASMAAVDCHVRFTRRGENYGTKSDLTKMQ